MRRTLLILALAVPTIATGDALTELRAMLAQLPAASPVRGTLELTSTMRPNDDEKPEAGKATIGFESDNAGLHILYPRAALIQADQEARSESLNPDRPTPTRNGVRRLRPLHVAELLDGAAALSVMLQDTSLVTAKPANYHGKPARLLTFKITPKMSSSMSKRMKKFEGALSLWIGDDGIPIAAERTMYAKASFLLMSFENDRKESWVYARVGDRLVVTRFEENEKTDGVGQHTSSQVVEVLRID